MIQTTKKIIKAILPYGLLVIYRRLGSSIEKTQNNRLRNVELDKQFESLMMTANKIKLTKKAEVIVSLTSYGHRLDKMAPITVASILNQTVLPDKIVLWLAHGEKPSNLLKNLKDFGLQIEYTKDTKSYKKLIPSLVKYPKSTVITIDDDIVYPADWLEKTIELHKINPKSIVFNRGRQIAVRDKRLVPYENWPLLTRNIKNSSKMLPTGVGGVLYPPNSLDNRVFSEEVFTELAPHGDDIWFWAMSELKNTKRVLVEGGFGNTLEYEMDNDNASRLSMINDNTSYLYNMMKKYPPLAKKLKVTVDGQPEFPGSAEYWEARYAAGGNSGAGSYNALADYKAKVLNRFVKNHKVSSVIEFGVGDGNQLELADYPKYVGFDVSKTAISKCKQLFDGDKTKEFLLLSEYKDQKADLVMSLDVLYHLIERSIFEEHIKNLFKASGKYVIIYAYDGDEFSPADHVKSRSFTRYIKENIPNWNLIKHIPNRYPYNPLKPDTTTWADFYIYKKI